MQSEVQGHSGNPSVICLSQPDSNWTREAQIAYFDGAETIIHKALDRITRTAAFIFDVPMAFISFVGTENQTVKSLYGLPEGFGKMPSHESICRHTIATRKPTVILDTLNDPRSSRCPAVFQEPHLRYYVGAPLVTRNGVALGSLCVVDKNVHNAQEPKQLEILEQLADETVDQLEFFVAKRDLLTYESALLRKEIELNRQRRDAARHELRSTLALEAGRLGTWEWDAATGRSVWSPVLHQIFGLSDGSHNGTLEAWIESILPADRAKVLKHVQDARAARTSFETTYRIAHPDGSIRSVCEKGAFQRDSSGRAIGAVGVCWDITDQETARRALRKSEELFRELSDSCPVGVFLADAHGNATYLNPKACEIWQLPLEEMLDRGWATRIHPDDMASHVTSQIEAGARGESSSFTYRLLLPDRTIRWIECRSASLTGADGQPVGVVGTVIDITQQREIEDQLRVAKEAAEDANQAKALLLANVSHELRTPLNGILGMAEILSVTALTPEQQEFNQVIQDAGRSLAQIVDDLLDLSSAHTGELRVENRIFDPQSVVSRALAIVRPAASAKGLHLFSKYPAQGIPFIEGDEDRIRQILLNFLGNAVKFTSAGSVSVSIAVDEAGTEAGPIVEISVVDTGVGISPNDQARLFRAFTQIDPSSSRRHGGAGLGLALSRRLASLMKGTVGVESQPGNGSRFWLRLPFRPVFEN